MQQILDFLKGMAPADRESFAARCGTTLGYLRKAVSAKQRLGIELCVSLDRESGGVLRCNDLYPAVDWRYLCRVSQRVGSAGCQSDAAISNEKAAAAPASQAQAATENVAVEVSA